MAETSVSLLGKILGVLEAIDRKSGGGATSSAQSRDEKGRFIKKSATISNIFDEIAGSKKNTKTAAENVNQLTVALKNLSTVKFNVFNKLALDITTKTLKGLVDFAIYVGEHKTKVAAGSKLIGSLSDSLTKIATAIPKFFGYLALSMLGFVLSLVIIGKILAVEPGRIAIAFGAILGTLFLTFWSLGKLDIEKGQKVIKGMSESLIYLSGGMLAFALTVALIPRLLGVGVRATNEAANFGTAAIGVGIIAASLGLLIFTFWGLGKLKDEIKDGTDIVKDMGKGILYLVGSMVLFAIGVALIPRILGVGTRAKHEGANFGTAAIGVGIIAGSIIAIAFGYMWLGKGDEKIKKGTAVAKDMGIGIMLLAASMVVFALAVALVPRILGVGSRATHQKENIGTAAIGAGIIMGSIMLFAVGFWRLGLLDKTGAVERGAITAMFIAGAIALLGIGVLIFAKSAQTITSMGDKEKTTDTGKHRGKFGNMMAAIGPGLGAMGIIIVSAALLLAALGIPPVAALIGLGAAVAIGVSLALIAMAKSIKAVSEAVKDLTPQQIEGNISMAVSSVIKGVTHGVNEGFTGMKKDNGRLDFKKFRDTKRAMRMLGSIAESISKFAEGLRAFQTAGKIGKVEIDEIDTGRIDSNGDKIYKTKVTMDKSQVVSVVDVAANLSSSLKVFVESVADTAEHINIHRLKRLRRALGGGEDGIMGPIVGFGNLIRTFSDMKDGRIPVYDPETNKPIMDGRIPRTIDLKETAIKVANGFGAFINTFTKALDPATVNSLDNSDIKKISNLTSALGDLVNAQEGLDKMATSMGVLATNIGALSTNLKALDTTNLAKATIMAGEYQKRYGKYETSGTAAAPGGASAAIIANNTTSGRQFSNEDLIALSRAIGDQLNATFKNKPFQFKFASGESMSGVLQ